MNAYREYYHRHLPHWQPKEATFFVTIHLSNSLSHEEIIRLKNQRTQMLKILSNIDNPIVYEHRNDEIEKLYFAQWDTALAKSKSNQNWLNQGPIAQILTEALIFRNGKLYQLWAYCIMPNHLHVVFTLLKQSDGNFSSLQSIMQSFKRFTGQMCNQVLQRHGSFWQTESYDHVVRDQDELKRIVYYVMNNPVKAGFVSQPRDWQWSYSIL